MSFDVRPAIPRDACALHAMNAAFNGDTGVSVEQILRSLLVSPEVVLIAECGGAPAGFCCAQMHHSFCYPAPAAEVTEMYVCPAFRGQGCAGEMLAFLQEHLRTQHGADEVHLLTATENLSAQAAYRKAGFVSKEEQYMKKALQKGPQSANSP